jgi:hypothetical protein
MPEAVAEIQDAVNPFEVLRFFGPAMAAFPAVIAMKTQQAHPFGALGGPLEHAGWWRRHWRRRWFLTGGRGGWRASLVAAVDRYSIE